MFRVVDAAAHHDVAWRIFHGHTISDRKGIEPEDYVSDQVLGDDSGHM